MAQLRHDMAIAIAVAIEMAGNGYGNGNGDDEGNDTARHDAATRYITCVCVETLLRAVQT